MFINAGARDLLLQGERQKFLNEEWPRIRETIQRLGLKEKELLNGAISDPSAEKDGRLKTRESKTPEEKS
jgi:GntR family transcriptional regulator